MSNNHGNLEQDSEDPNPNTPPTTFPPKLMSSTMVSMASLSGPLRGMLVATSCMNNGLAVMFGREALFDGVPCEEAVDMHCIFLSTSAHSTYCLALVAQCNVFAFGLHWVQQDDVMAA